MRALTTTPLFQGKLTVKTYSSDGKEFLNVKKTTPKQDRDIKKYVKEKMKVEKGVTYPISQKKAKDFEFFLTNKTPLYLPRTTQPKFISFVNNEIMYGELYPSKKEFIENKKDIKIISEGRCQEYEGGKLIKLDLNA